MRFTRLRLNGFKSFADPVEMIIHEGLTGIVGPNGCGKSNLLEALRWVMGENRPSAMRGSGMEDVIFNGASSRGARNFAEVALELDNRDRRAPAGFNDSDTVEITRRINRQTGSVYRANGREVRARDVQIMFADASSGSHSPSLVRQGQISELINARPKERRRVLEEAAGISGLYARRHEAEQKLSGTEQNLTRVDEVLESLSGRLALLSRQAKQAARYRDIAGKLRQAESLLLCLRWQESVHTADESEAAHREQLQKQARSGQAERDSIAAREKAEADLPGKREEEAIATAILQRLTLEIGTVDQDAERAQSRIGGLEARRRQIGTDLGREEELNRDADETISRLEVELAGLEAAQTGHDGALARAAASAGEAQAELALCESVRDKLAEEDASLRARHQALKHRLDDEERAADRLRTEAERAAQAAGRAKATMLAASESLVKAESAHEGAVREMEAAEQRAIVAEADRKDAESSESAAHAALHANQGRALAITAEHEALLRLVEQRRASGAQIMDRLKVEAGHEKALGAALADDLHAPEIGPDGETGWVHLPPLDSPPLPAGVAPLGVRGPETLARRLSQIGIVAKEKGAALQAMLRPGQRLVSLEGDLWRWDGYRAMAADRSQSAALQLEQVNRLKAVGAELAVAESAAAAARAAHAAAEADLTESVRTEREAQEARRLAERARNESERARNRAEADRTIATGQYEAQEQVAARLQAELATARKRADASAAEYAVLADPGAVHQELEAARQSVETARAAMLSCRHAHEDLRRAGETRQARHAAAAAELTAWKARLGSAGKRTAELVARRQETEAELGRAHEMPAILSARRAELAQRLQSAEERKRAATAALGAAEDALHQAQESERIATRQAGEARESVAASAVRLESAREAVAVAAHQIHEERGETPRTLLDSLAGGLDPGRNAAELEQEIANLRRQRESLGAVNLRAEEDFREIETEYQALAHEKADLEEAVARLRTGISGLNREGRERLLAAFEQVHANFRQLFTHLFGGGEARLVMVESDDPLEAGLEIMCQPPGKRLATLSLLSGGEQTLTALALIFAVFLANPAPICVLDEVDAPLDDANVTRFCDMMDEMTRRAETRFLVITHHAVTMARMDRLFGVTMQEQGVSQLVSVDLRQAEEMVA